MFSFYALEQANVEIEAQAQFSLKGSLFMHGGSKECIAEWKMVWKEGDCTVHFMDLMVLKKLLIL